MLNSSAQSFQSKPDPMVFIIILNWNGWRDTIECLESVYRLHYSNFKVVVCDNASTDDSLSYICAWANGKQPANALNPDLAYLTNPPIAKPIAYQVLTRAEAELQQDCAMQAWTLNLIQTGDNLGFSSGNNVGLRFAIQAGCDFVWLLNNDTVVETNALSALVAKSQSQDNRIICGSTILYYDAPNNVQVLGGGRYSNKTGVSYPVGTEITNLAQLNIQAVVTQEIEQRLQYIVGASMFVPFSFLKEVGLLNQAYFLYYEELDWAERGHRAAYKLGYAPMSVVYHKLGVSAQSTASARSRSFISDYHQTRSRMIFIQTFHPHKLVWLRLTLIVGGFKRLLWGRPKHALMQWKWAISQVQTSLSK